MVEKSCWIANTVMVKNSSWVKAHRTNFTFFAYVLEFNKPKEDPCQEWKWCFIKMNFWDNFQSTCAYLKWLSTKVSRCDASLLRRATLWVRSILAVKKKLTAKCCRYGIDPPDTPKPTFWRSDSSHIEKQRQFLKKYFDTDMAFS